MLNTFAEEAVKKKILFMTWLFFTFIGHLPAQDLNATDSEHLPRIPPGQSVIDGFPILRICAVPDIDHSNWSLKVTGRARNNLELDFDALMELPSAPFTLDFHCVTGWSALDVDFHGILLRDLIALADPLRNARFVTFKAADGYYTSLPIDECTGDHDILAVKLNGCLIETDKGGPVRMIIPLKYGYKSAMWLTEIKLTRRQELGYWEKRGYHNNADPWKEERKQ